MMDGILLVDKPKGWTSHDVVARVRSILRTASQKSKVESKKSSTENLSTFNLPTGQAGFQLSTPSPKVKVGHAGTLDPLATGLLVILVGSYCKRAQEFSKLDKTYEVTMKLGFVSETGDEEGKKTKVSAKMPTLKQIQADLSGFTGEIDQIPPAYSAIKVGGQRAYKLARAGKEVKLEPRKVTIYGITDVSYDYPTIKFTTKVSSGTYIRSLVEDIGKKLGTGAYMSDLRRTEVGEYKVTEAKNVELLTKS